MSKSPAKSVLKNKPMPAARPMVGLGRGLSDIIAHGASAGAPALPQSGPKGVEVQQVPLSKIITNPRQPRMRFTEEPLDELVSSIREHGVLQPITVRPNGQKFEIIAGERRFRACQKAGLETIPVLVKSVSDVEAYELALIENLQRENLDPMEEAAGYRRLIQDFSLTQEQVATKVGKNRATVANAVRLLDLPQEVQGYLAQGRLSPGHAKAILGLQNTEEQIRLAREVLKHGFNVRQTEAYANRLRGETSSGKRKKVSASGQTDPQLRAIQEALQQKLATKVSIHPSGNGGKIEIQYYTPSDFDRLLGIFNIQL